MEHPIRYNGLVERDCGRLKGEKWQLQRTTLGPRLTIQRWSKMAHQQSELLVLQSIPPPRFLGTMWSTLSISSVPHL